MRAHKQQQREVTYVTRLPSDPGYGADDEDSMEIPNKMGGCEQGTFSDGSHNDSNRQRSAKSNSGSGSDKAREAKENRLSVSNPNPNRNIGENLNIESSVRLAKKLMSRRRFHPMGSWYQDVYVPEPPVIETKRLSISPGMRTERSRKMAAELKRALSSISTFSSSMGSISSIGSQS
uniref:Uncharacterized protein n=1 Tax=Lotharella globosa TaxID=91324 RepID=A0A7S3ZIQ5_9EUKA|mmetsp:Transcript_13797/g.27923  ORF Transcript_13797/g.27923 Transcript_13797/m.27923 type:complete len:177 (+) Transcript_13797:56-586(+)